MSRAEVMNGSETTIILLIKQPSAGDKVFSDELTKIFQWITFTFLCQAVTLFGVGSNTINIMCFVRQGFKDPVNVSLLGLAVADMSSLITIMWSNLCLNPAFITLELPFEPMEFQYLISAMPHATFTRISSWITALITMERCLCIIAPIKVKSIVTSKRIFLVIICLFIVFVVNTAPLYVVTRLGWKFFPERNKTLIGMLFMGDRERVEQVFYIINNVCFPFGAFITITISTIILVIQLRKKSEWRKQATVSTQADNVSQRNQKVAKMVLMISALFISCMAPLCVFFIAMTMEPELSIVGSYRNVIFVFVGFGLLLESINSSANIFIYYHMSSKYKTALHQSACFRYKRIG